MSPRSGQSERLGPHQHASAGIPTDERACALSQMKYTRKAYQQAYHQRPEVKAKQQSRYAEQQRLIALGRQVDRVRVREVANG